MVNTGNCDFSTKSQLLWLLLQLTLSMMEVSGWVSVPLSLALTRESKVSMSSLSSFFNRSPPGPKPEETAKYRDSNSSSLPVALRSAAKKCSSPKRLSQLNTNTDNTKRLLPAPPETAAAAEYKALSFFVGFTVGFSLPPAVVQQCFLCWWLLFLASVVQSETCTV